MHIVDRSDCTPLQQRNITESTNQTKHDDDTATVRGTDKNSTSDVDDEMCKCNYISIVEPPFETSAGIRTGKRLCSVARLGHETPADYTGYGRSLMIHLSLAHSGPDEGFNLTIVSEREFASHFRQYASKIHYSPNIHYRQR